MQLEIQDLEQFNLGSTQDSISSMSKSDVSRDSSDNKIYVVVNDYIDDVHCGEFTAPREIHNGYHKEILI